MSKVVDLTDARLKKRGLSFVFIPSSKGYPLYRDPAAENRPGAMSQDLDEAALHKLRQRYAPTQGPL